MVPPEQFSSLDIKSTLSSHLRVPSDNNTDNQVIYSDYEWITYCPDFFSTFQKLANIDADDYMLSVCCVETLKYVTSPGKNGFFYLPHDDRFIIKNMRKAEMKVALEMLPKYYQHVWKYKSTLLTKFYGLHLVKTPEGQRVRLLVMGNPLKSDLPIHKRFDLKGSSQGRCGIKMGTEKSTILKDQDLDLAFHLDPLMKSQLLAQIKTDCEFLEGEGAMDYSLLLGMHICRPAVYDFLTRDASKHSSNDSSFQSDQEQDSTSVCDEEQSCDIEPGITLGVRMPARAVRIVRKEKGCSISRAKEEPFDVVLYIGFMNIFQQYNMVKKMERAVKSLQYDSYSISAVNPKVYASRFQDFMSKVFRGYETKAVQL